MATRRRTYRSAARTSPALRAALVRLGARVRDVREGHGLTQHEMAERSELAEKHLALIERGGTNPTAASLIAIADALGVTLSDLVSGV